MLTVWASSIRPSHCLMLFVRKCVVGQKNTVFFVFGAAVNAIPRAKRGRNWQIYETPLIYYCYIVITSIIYYCNL